MKWNEVTRIEVKGKTLAIKDAMVMLSNNEITPEGPSITCEPGEYILEIYVPVPFHAHRVRMRKVDSDPKLGNEIGAVEIDHAFVGFIDYELFLASIKEDFESYEEWTMMELDDELTLNFSGEILFNNEKLVYVKSGDGDGTYPVYELVANDKQVGIECVFIP
ncbi:MAG: hypothetical protein GKR92_07620 [Gammaproteobacteria bacterium]|nr:MAG: hypothetical protein GKR92_07620 [Gammaproteobacteria bacterium]